MAIDTVRIKDLEEVSVNDLANLWMVVDSGTPDSTNKVKLSALAGYIGGQADGRYIPLAGSSEITGSLLPKADKAIALGSGSFRWSALYSGEVHASDVLAIPTAAPSDPLPGEVYLYSGTGEYSETPGGGGGADVHDLTIRKNSTSLGTYNLGEEDADINIPVGWSDLTPDSTHRFLTDTQISTWNAKQDAINDLSTIRTQAGEGHTAYGWGNHASAGYASQSSVNTTVATLTPKIQAIPYIVGPDTDATAGTWTGTYEGITALTEGLTIVYVPHIAGATTTTLNINGLGAKTCYYSGTSKLTTHYPVGTPILFTYYNNGWRRADYNSNTTYSAGTKALFDAGANTSNRVWSASVLASAVAPIVHEHDWTDINNAPAFITADALSGYATETYVGNQITALNLGTASQKDYVTSITSGGTELPTAGAIYTYVNNAVTAAQPYKGVSSTAITDGGTEMPTISGYTTRTKGDVVAYNKKEFIWEGDKWRELGDEGSYALKTVQVIAGTGLTGGGAISQDITLSLSSAAQASLALADTALQSSDLDGYVNAISQGSGNYVTGITKSGKTLTISRGTLPTTIAWTNVTGRPTALSDFTDDILSGHYLPLSAGYDYPLTDTLYLQSIIPTADLSYSLGTDTKRFGLGYFFFLSSTMGQFTNADVSALLSIPQVAPDTTDDFYDSTKTYLYASSLGEYSETPGGGGTATVYDLTLRKNGTAIGTYNLGTAAADVNIPIGWSDLTPDANHRFLTDTLISTWNGKQDAISDLSTIRTNAGHGNTAYGWGDHSQAGYLTSYTETDPVFSASAAAGITSSNISTWNGKYTKPSTGIPKTDLASAVQTTLTNADTAYGWGNHASAGYLTSSSLDGYVNEIATGTGNYISGVSKSGKKLTFTYGTLPTTIAWGSVTGKPTTISGYGITDAKIANGTITLGSNSITPLTSFTETDPTVPSWAKASSKPTYTLDEVADGSTRKLADYVSKVTSTDNAIARFDGTAGQLQNSLVTIDDSGNIFFPIATSTSFSANAKIVLGNAWFGSNPTGGLAYGTRDGSTYTSKYCFEGIQFRPVSTADNQINIGTTSYRWKNIYLAGTIGNGTYALTLPSKSGTIAVTSDLNSYLPLTGGTLTGDLVMSSGTTLDTDAAKLAIPTAAPSSPTSGKIYLYASSLGEYAVEPWYGFNQLISNGNMESTTGWGTVYSGYTRTVENNVLTITITSATYRPQVRTALSVANGHWVYYTYTMKYTTSAAYSDVKTAFLYPTPLYIPTGNQKDADFYDWKKTSGIVKVNAAKTYLYIGRTAASSHTFAVGDTVQIKNVMVCDLTEMFGENIPTVEQFEAMYPQDYYDYTPIGG